MTEEAVKAVGRPPKLYPVKLLKNTAPGTHRHEIRGYWTDEIRRKLSNGQMDITPSKFIPDQGHPPPYPGVGTATPKIWAGTVVAFEKDKANELVKARLAERADEFGDD